MGTATLILLILSLVMFVVAIAALFYDEAAAAGGLAIIGILLFLVAMSVLVIDKLNNPEHGIVTGKIFVKKHLRCGKVCVTVPDSWYLVLDDHGNVGDVQVAHSTYNNKHVGDYFGGSK